MMINRILGPYLQRRLSAKISILILGPVHSGKSTLINEIVFSIDPDFETVECKDSATLKIFTQKDLSGISHLINSKKTLFIKNIQCIPDFRNTFSQLIGSFPGIQFIAAGSYMDNPYPAGSTDFLSEEAQLLLFPLSWQEYSEYETLAGSKAALETRLVYGMYPEVIANPGKESEVLQNLYDDFLFENIFSAISLRKPLILKKLVQVLALNIGQEISLNQLSDIIKVDKNTVNTYINALERAFVVFRLNAFGRNHLHEVKSSKKIFFYDNGLRNAAIVNFNLLNLRQDTEALWENFCIAERQKFLYNRQKQCSSYFWRTTGKKMVDYIEEYEDGLHAYEFIWNRQSDKFFSKTFRMAYPAISTDIISPTNFTKFVGSSKIK